MAIPSLVAAALGLLLLLSRSASSGCHSPPALQR